MHKIPSNAKLLTLPEEQQAQLAAWLLAGMTYPEARQRMAAEYGVRVENDRPFTDFWQKVCVPELHKRREQAMHTAREIVRKAAGKPNQFGSAALELLQQKIFELATTLNTDTKEVKNVFSMVLQTQKHELSKAHLALARDKHEFNAAETCLKILPELKAIEANPALDQAAKINAIREKLFGKLPSASEVSA